ncbi:uncharacterized protein LOC128883040 [Hylaeus volcanicus]|uniref:uncharacterized protein LOC128883040 n=1 Tax=Hylaeus volcanicus TaxID=313075 RepID=UPI0023B7E585|nr:uncharacterized protein LOC128883040 [Hylaeus volcanicus]
MSKFLKRHSLLSPYYRCPVWVTNAHKTNTFFVYDPFSNNRSVLFHTLTKATFQKYFKTSELMKMISRLYPFFWLQDSPHRFRVIFSVASMIVAKLITIQTPLLLGQLIDNLSQNEESILNNLPNEFLNKTRNDNGSVEAPIIEKPVPLVLSALALISGYGASRILASGFNELRNALFSRVSYSACSAIACTTFKHLHSIDLDILLQSKAGELSLIISRGIRSITGLLNALLFQIVPSILEFSLVLSLLAWKVGKDIAGATLVTMAAYVIFTAKVTQKRTVYRKLMNEAEQKTSGVLLDSIMNSESIRFFANEPLELGKYRSIQKHSQNASIKVAQSLAFLNFGQQLIFNVGLCSSMLLTASHILSNTIPVGTMAFVSSLLFQLSIPLNMLGSVYRDTRSHLVDLEKLYEVLSIKPTCFSIPHAKSLQLTPTSAIKFEDVSFGYKKDNIDQQTSRLYEPTPYSKYTPILSNLNLEIPQGSKIGIVGTSGSGKSTLFKLLFRLYDPHEGRITINGDDLRTLNIRSLRENIGIVPQDLTLFHDTILMNLRYGNMNASFQQVIQATKAAQIYDTIINNFSQGFDTIVGERGLKLSGGEKQRIAIARCLLRNPRILLLDEPTSCLDSITEKNIMNQFKKLTDTTVIVVAHRLGTIVDANMIYVFNRGRIVEQGTHQQLISIPNGYYSDLWNEQRRNDLSLFTS